MCLRSEDISAVDLSVCRKWRSMHEFNVNNMGIESNELRVVGKKEEEWNGPRGPNEGGGGGGEGGGGGKMLGV